MANDLQSQIQAQRQAISTEQSQLQQARLKAMQVPQQELRGTQRGIRGAIGSITNALMRRTKVGQRVRQYDKPTQQLQSQSQEFEREVARNVPEYGKPELVQQEFEIAKSKLEPKINQLQQVIQSRQIQLEKYAGTDRENELQTDINAYKTELQTLQSYLADPIKAIKGVNTGQAFQEASIKASNVYSQRQYSQAIKQAGFSSITEYAKLKPLLTKLQTSGLTQQEVSQLPKNIQEQITYTDVPATQLGGVQQLSLQQSGGYYVDPRTGEGFSMLEGANVSGLVKVGEFGEDFSKIQARTQTYKTFGVIQQPSFQFKPEFQGTYQSGSGMFVTPAPGVPEVSRSTLYMRQPTPEEQIDINKGISAGAISSIPDAYDIYEKYKGSTERFFAKQIIPRLPENAPLRRFAEDKPFGEFGQKIFGSESRTGNIWLMSEQELKDLETSKTEVIKDTEKLKELEAYIDYDYNRLKQLEKGLDLSSEKDVSEYNRLVEEYQGNVNEYERLKNKVESSIKTTGFLGLGQETPITDISKSLFGRGFETITRGASELGFDIVKPSIYDFSERLSVRPTQALQFLGGTKDVARIDFEKGTYDIGTFGGVQPTEELLTIRKIEGKDRFSKALAFGAGGAVALSPYIATGYAVGSLLYGAEVERSLRPFKYNPIEFFKAKPTEAILTFAPLGVVGGLKVTRYLREPLLKTVPGGFRTTNRWNEIMGARLKFSKPDKALGIKTDFLPSVRGRYFIEKEIPKPLADLKTTPIGLDKVNKVKFPRQQLEQTSEAGKRTIVKDIKETFFGKIKEELRYTGVPYKDKRYEDVFENLKNILGESKARQTLRYTAPKVEKQFLEAKINIKDSLGIGVSKISLEKPVIDVDKVLGIKTRAGRTIKETEAILRIGADKKAIEVSAGATFEKGKNLINIKGFDFEKGLTVIKKTTPGKAGDISFQVLDSSTLKVKTPFDRRIFIDEGRTLLVKKIPKEEKIFNFQGGGKKSSQEYIQSLYRQELKTIQVKRIIKEPKIKRTQETKLDIIQENEISPVTISKIERQESKYFGTGLYERTEDLSFSDIKPDSKSISISPVLIEQETKVTQDIGLKSIQGLKNVLDLKPIQSPKLEIKTISSLKPIEVVKVKKATQLKPVQVQVVKTKLTPISRATPRQITRARIIPKKTIKIKLTPEDPIKSKLKQIPKRKRDEEFLAITKRYGKEIVIAKGKDIGQLVSLGKKQISQTLGATLKIKTTAGKQIGLTPTKGFRPSKVNPLSIVQIRETRLGTFGERREIKQARRGALSLI